MHIFCLNTFTASWSSGYVLGLTVTWFAVRVPLFERASLNAADSLLRKKNSVKCLKASHDSHPVERER